jgi:Xaa-Pro dipeptidase
MMVDIDRANAMMKLNGLDALVAFSRSNVFYLTGHQMFVPAMSESSSTFAVLPRNSEPILIMPVEEEGYFLTGERQLNNRHFYGKPFGTRSLSEKPKDEGDEFKLVAESLRTAGVTQGCVGYDEESTPVSQFNRLRKELAETKLVNATSLFQKLRLVKNEEEITRLKKSSDVLETSYMTALSTLKEGVTEREFVHEFKRAALAADPDCTILHTSTGFGPRGGLGGGTFPSNYRAEPGDVISFDAGVLCNKYCSDTSRCVTVRPTSDVLKKMYKACFSAQQTGISMLKPGAKISDIWKTIMKTVRATGFPDYFGAYFGHSIGLQTHEWPSVAQDAEISLEKNMVFEIEVGLYISDVGSVCPEDCVIIREDGPEFISDMNRDLYEL